MCWTTSERGAARGAILLVAGIVLVLGIVLVSSYNGLVGKKEKVGAAWSQIDNEYKRRNDLVPNLVATVQGAANFEKSTLTAVTEARASVGRVQLPKDVPTDEKQLAAYIAAQQGLGAALGRLMVVAEAYPDLKSSAAFRDLQVQLEGPRTASPSPAPTTSRRCVTTTRRSRRCPAVSSPASAG
jgi:LemA protein